MMARGTTPSESTAQNTTQPETDCDGPSPAALLSTFVSPTEQAAAPAHTLSGATPLPGLGGASMCVERMTAAILAAAPLPKGPVGRAALAVLATILAAASFRAIPNLGLHHRVVSCVRHVTPPSPSSLEFYS